ncbi:MAG: hypothetical protein Q9217_004886 [Psora testacea]
MTPAPSANHRRAAEYIGLSALSQNRRISMTMTMQTIRHADEAGAPYLVIFQRNLSSKTEHPPAMAPPPPPPSGSLFYGRGLNLLIITIVFPATAVLLVISRLAARGHIGNRLVLSDYAIILSTVNFLAIVRMLLSGKLADSLRAFWASQIIYKVTINLTKASICLLYLQIFPGNTFRRVTYLVMTFVLLYAIASIIATIVQCNPISYAWDRRRPGTCINLTAFWYANAAANILGDCIILILPIPSTMALAIPQRQKHGLILVFTLGAFVCVTSILRMTTLKSGSRAHDVTYGTLNSTIWTAIEANTGIMCACLPMLKAPLMAMFPRLFRQSSYGTREPSGPPHSHRLPSDATSPHSPHFSIPLSPGFGKYNESNDHFQPAVQTHISTGTEGKSAGSSDCSGDDTFGTTGHGVPLGYIAKTTNVDARSDIIYPGSPRSKRSGKDHVQTPSEGPLVDRNPKF